MPQKKKQTKKPTKKTNKKAPKTAKRKQSSKHHDHMKLRLWRGTFPQNLWTTLVYGDSYNLDSAASYIQQFRMNSLYDPDFTLTGGQPRYYDTLCGADGSTAPYLMYRVHSYNVVVYVNTTSAIPTAVSFTIHSSDISPPASLQEAYERVNDTKIVRLGALTGSDTLKVLKISGRVKDILGCKDLADISGTGVNYNANPASPNLIYGTLRLWSISGATPYTATVDTKIMFHSQFYKLNDVADS